ncbi:MAG: TetR/AcrR family transcriptional regulator [Thermoprotei archaeon]|nr:TetR/AcrR family transcriptional regulator [TACK group archaeon]
MVESTEEKILKAAIKVFAKKGFDAATTDEIASKSGVSKGTVFLYFKRKDALIERVALASVPFAEIEDSMKKHYSSPQELLFNVGMAFLNKYRDQDLRSLLIMSMASKDRYRRVGKSLQGLCFNSMGKMFDEVEKMIGKPFSEPLRRAYFGSLLCYVVWWEYDKITPDEYCRTLVTDLLKAIRA